MAKSAQSKTRTPNRTSKTKPKKTGKKQKYERAEHGFMYIGHLPHGFFEEEIKSYFGQFGKVVRVRVARSKKTGEYRGYGFVEFGDKDVAQIAADTMNNYLMFNKVLKCHVIPAERVHPDTFRNAGKLFVKPVKSWLRKSFNRKRSVGQLTVRILFYFFTFFTRSLTLNNFLF
jgi:nucleolar protein 15